MMRLEFTHFLDYLIEFITPIWHLIEIKTENYFIGDSKASQDEMLGNLQFFLIFPDFFLLRSKMGDIFQNGEI